ncbi:MAG: hypothetical protein ABW160_03985, partial [Candidatus Thiodiazotropha sp. 4PDIV1]
AHRSSTVVLLQGTYTPSVHAHAGRTQKVGWRYAYPTYNGRPAHLVKKSQIKPEFVSSSEHIAQVHEPLSYTDNYTNPKDMDGILY